MQPTPLEEDEPDEALCDTDIEEEAQRSPHTEEVDEPEACLGELYNLDPSLFLQVDHKEKLSRSEQRKQRQLYTARRKEAADQNRPETISKDQLIELQKKDPTLAIAGRQADKATNGYAWRNDVLVKLNDQSNPDSDYAFVLPQLCRSEVLKMAHSTPTAGHFGRKRTLERLQRRFHWPGMREAVTQVCNSCPVCQKAEPPTHHRAPLQPLPVIDTPFQRVAMDIFGPLKRTKQGNRYILVLMDYATKWPEAYPMRAVDSESVARTLIDIFSRLGVPDELLTDNGSNFTSRLMKRFYDLTGIHHLKTSAYHPATDGMVERFNKTLKQTLRKLTQKSSDDWDACIPYLMWAYRGTVHASTGFSPFELVYGRQMRDGLDVLADVWKEEKDTDPIAVIEYLRKLRERMQQAREIVQETETKAKESHKKFYDRNTISREFKKGDMVLVLLPKLQYKLICEWQGPYEVVEKKSSVTYVIDVSDSKKRLRTFHINALKEWVSPVPAVLSVAETEDVEPLTWHDESAEKPQNSNLTPAQEQDLERLLLEFEDVISDVPGKTELLEHRIETGDEAPVRLRMYQTPHALRDKLREEIKEMLTNGIITPSTSEWAAPIILVPKKDGSKRLCVDFRKLNSKTKPDPYPMPRIDEMIDRLGKAKYISALDLTKGYWQVPVAPDHRHKTAFVLPFGKFEFTTMPFGLMGAPSTFQRLMDRILGDIQDFSAAYLDDVIVYSDSWEEHLRHLSEVLRRLGDAGLKVKAKKCQFARNTCAYLGHVVGEGRVEPATCKVQAILDFPGPLQTKKSVRAFLGLAGYYRRFIPNFATIAVPLSDLTKASLPNKVKWTPDCEKAFIMLKKALMDKPVLRNPDFQRPFTLQTDASDVGLGAVLSQTDDVGEEHPVAYYSRKLLPRETRYAAVEKECLAVVEGIRHFRVYLEGTPFMVQTDHRSLKYLHKMKDSTGRLARWSLFLQPYSFTIHHRAGKNNGNADGLSRVLSEAVVALDEGEMSGIHPLDPSEP